MGLQALFRLDLSPRNLARLISMSGTSYLLTGEGAATFTRPTLPQ